MKSEMCLAGSFPAVCIESIPNMRLLCQRRTAQTYNANTSFTSSSCGGLYRSSKPDRILRQDLDEFRKLGIKCIIDFRSPGEYYGGHLTNRLLDRVYIPYKVVVPKKHGQELASSRVDPEKYLPQLENESESLSADTAKDNQDTDLDLHFEGKPSRSAPPQTETQDQDLDEEIRKHYLIDFFSGKYIFKTFFRLPCYLCFVGIVYLMYDLVRQDKSFKTFGAFFASSVLNRSGIKRQYIDMVEYCQPSICAALKLVAEPSNHPALINCAHGKDRTGLISALVLSCLGVPQEVMAEEYARSEAGLKPVIHLVRRDLIEKYSLKEEFLSADADNILNTLRFIDDTYGSAENYMESIGFSREEQQSLRDNFVVAASWKEEQVGEGEGSK